VRHRDHPDRHLHRLSHIQQLSLRFVIELPPEVATLSNLDTLMVDACSPELDLAALATCSNLRSVLVNSYNLAGQYMTIKGLEKLPGLEAFQFVPGNQWTTDVRILLGEGLVKVKEFVVLIAAGRLLLEGPIRTFLDMCKSAPKIALSMHEKCFDDEKLGEGIGRLLAAARFCGVDMQPGTGGGVMMFNHPVLGKGSYLQVNNMKQYLKSER
jgi:hypothetical protein